PSPERACCRRPTCNASAAAERSAVAALRAHPHARFPPARFPRRQLLTPLDPAQAVAPVLAQHLLEVVEPVRVDAGTHRAAGLAAVAAVAEAAARRERRHIGEARKQRAFIGVRAQRAQARTPMKAR